MKLSLFNTLTRAHETFEPHDPNLVKMYVCGPTVYDYPHIGNARSVVVYDVLYRVLMRIYGAHHVKYVRNITDVDDKIIDRAKELEIKISDLTITTTNYFHQDTDYLNCLHPTTEPRATDHIQEMIEIIQRLISLNHAYIAAGHVYFDVMSANNYNALSGRSFDEMQSAEQDAENIGKKHPADFVLWKPAKKGEAPDANFESPFGIGRPGWHIECSSMSHKYLGENFDIHGGGADLIFPHHTNEIAQSTCAFPNSSFAHMWVHNGFLTVGGEKMSKSLGNFLTVKDLRDRNTSGDVLRLFLLSAHYRKPLDFNDKALSDAYKTIDYWYRATQKVELTENEEIELPSDFLAAIYDDLNIPLAIKIINDYAKVIHSTHTIQGKALYALKLLSCANFIGLMKSSASEWFQSDADEDDISELIKKRTAAKLEKNWQLADEIREMLEMKNIIVEDKPDGTSTWRKK